MITIRIFRLILAATTLVAANVSVWADTGGARFMLDNLLRGEGFQQEPDAAVTPQPEVQAQSVVVLPRREIVVPALIESRESQRHDDPAFVTEPLHPGGQARVFGVADAGDADVVILDHGLNQGFRIGMVCRVSRGGRNIGEIILVEVRDDRAAGLILALQENFSIQSGDTARIQTLQL